MNGWLSADLIREAPQPPGGRPSMPMTRTAAAAAPPGPDPAAGAQGSAGKTTRRRGAWQAARLVVIALLVKAAIFGYTAFDDTRRFRDVTAAQQGGDGLAATGR